MQNNFKTTFFHIFLLFILFFSAFFLAKENDIKTTISLNYPWLTWSTNLWQNVNAQASQTAYVATNLDACGDFTPCYTNTTGVDGQNGLGTGLREAVTALNQGDEIVVLGNYTIKDNSVLVDKNLTIRGYENATITYTGDDCNMPMLNITAGGIFNELTINGGNCAGVPRDLISINTIQDLRIENNTLQSGNRALNIIQNDGTVSVAFNHITENQEYALYQEVGSGNGSVDIFANNIFGNRTGVQVNCSGDGSVDHNYWGEGILPDAAAENCDVSNVKRLGAPITTLPDVPGVQAMRQTVTENFNYAFEENIGVKRNSGNDYDLIIVNHSYGSEDNIPFLGSGSTPIVACSNFYDVFLANGAVASDLVLSLKYDLNNTCLDTVESSDFCANDDSSKYPLWWFDPLNNLTDGWDRTGQIPEGDNPLNAEGQTTTCNMTENEIQVVIDSSGRPGITQDLNFTPFLAGLPIGSSNIKEFAANFDVDEVDIFWGTGQESSISGYYVLRANSESGPYYRISSLIPSKGSNSLYEYMDLLEPAEFNKNYYYKVEIINTYGDTIRTHGPISLLTSTPTPSLTPTRTLYPTRTPYPTSTSGPTRTATLYYYRSPTSLYRPGTSTPYGTPTQVRTDRQSPTATFSSLTITADPNGTPTPDLSTVTPEPSSLNSTEVPTFTPTAYTLTPESYSTMTPTQSDADKPGIQNNGQNSWIYLLIGGFTGLGFMSAASLYFYKKYFF